MGQEIKVEKTKQKSDTTTSNEVYKAVDFGFKYPRHVVCQSIHDDWEGFRILVSAEGKRWVRIKFPSGVAFRRINESDFLKSMPNIPKPIETLYEILDSEFLEWIKTESCGVSDKYRHFRIITTEEIIDVLDYDPPTIELL